MKEKSPGFKKSDGIELTPIKFINGEHGDVYHALKSEENSFSSFGEAYFSSVKKGAIKGWKRHTKMISNIIVPVGEIKFVIFIGDVDHVNKLHFREVVLSLKHYMRLTIYPGVWVAFQGLGEGLNLLLNVASIQHDPSESIDMPIDYLKYKW